MNEKLVVILKAIAWLSSSIGAVIAAAGSASFWVSESEIGSSMWPLPALVLIDWALLGLLSWLGAVKGARPVSQKWLDLAWFAAGGLLPLVILGGFSIGPLVLVGLLPLLVGSLSASLAVKAPILRGLGSLLIGAVCNLGLVLLFILAARA